MLLPQGHSETRPFVNYTALFYVEAIRWIAYSEYTILEIQLVGSAKMGI